MPTTLAHPAVRCLRQPSLAMNHAQTETYTAFSSTAFVETAAAKASQNALRVPTVYTPSVLSWNGGVMTYLRSVWTLDALTACAHFYNRNLQSYGIGSIVSTGSNGTDHTAKPGDRCRSTFCT